MSQREAAVGGNKAAVSPITAVLVLYRTPLRHSVTWQALQAAFAEDATLRSMLRLEVFDNSPEGDADAALESTAGAAAVGAASDPLLRYTWDGSNPGLARRYNKALARAAAAGSAWLLLLDQDTQLSAAYLRELRDTAAALTRTRPEVAAHTLLGPEVVAIVPRLMRGDAVLSPHAAPFAGGGLLQLDGFSAGTMERPVWAFNSGAALRVSALQAAGGFPRAFWLDYLDHATLHALRAHGGTVWLMAAALPHDLDEMRTDRPQDPARALNTLRAQAAFYRGYTHGRERLRYRAHLLRSARTAARDGRWQQALVRLRFALWLPTPPPAPSQTAAEARR